MGFWFFFFVFNEFLLSSASEYNLIRPIRGAGQYSDSSGALWEVKKNGGRKLGRFCLILYFGKSLCLTSKEKLAIKVVDSSNWKRLGSVAQKIIKLRRKIQSDKIVHFSQVFEVSHFFHPFFSRLNFLFSRF